MSQVTQNPDDDRKFTINFGPQHPAAHGVLASGDGFGRRARGAR